MTLSKELAAAVIARGRADFDELHRLYPALHRSQIHKALSRATERKEIRLIRRGKGGNGYQERVPGIYGAPDGMEHLCEYRPPNSPFELGADRKMPGGWPPTSHEGRRYQLLGGWTD